MLFFINRPLFCWIIDFDRNKTKIFYKKKHLSVFCLFVLPHIDYRGSGRGKCFPFAIDSNTKLLWHGQGHATCLFNTLKPNPQNVFCSWIFTAEWSASVGRSLTPIDCFFFLLNRKGQMHPECESLTFVPLILILFLPLHQLHQRPAPSAPQCILLQFDPPTVWLAHGVLAQYMVCLYFAVIMKREHCWLTWCWPRDISLTLWLRFPHAPMFRLPDGPLGNDSVIGRL